MKWQQTVLEGVSEYLPENRLTSTEIEHQLAEVYQTLRLPEGRLELMTGIRERGLWPRGTRSSDLATKAAKNLFDQQDFDPGEIDLLIHASVCRDFLEPSTASVVHANLGLNENTMIFDLSNACLGVVSGMTMAAELIERGSLKRALIVSGENGGPLLEDTIQTLIEKTRAGELNRKSMKRFLANLTIGSGAVAVSLTHQNMNPQAAQLKGSVTMTDSKANILCQGDGNAHGLMMETDSEALMQAGVELAKKSWAQAKEELFPTTPPDWVITHQVGVAHEKLTLESLGLSEMKTERTYPELGNTGSAALPLTLHKLIRSGRLQSGESVALLGIGSGLTSTMMGLQWK